MEKSNGHLQAPTTVEVETTSKDGKQHITRVHLFGLGKAVPAHPRPSEFESAQNTQDT